MTWHFIPNIRKKRMRMIFALVGFYFLGETHIALFIRKNLDDRSVHIPRNKGDEIGWLLKLQSLLK